MRGKQFQSATTNADVYLGIAIAGVETQLAWFSYFLHEGLH
jgi:hypothetical protein